MLSKGDIAILKNHVSNTDRDIYVIYNLPPEVVAVLFAYVSRSPASFRENLLKLIRSKDLDMGDLVRVYSEKGMDYGKAKEKAREFHEKWVVGYGHSSVAEHAVASIAVENVSILATKVIEDCRLASFTEKSTRYQVFEKGKYHKPGNLMNSEFAELYEKTCDHLLDFYKKKMPVMIKHMKRKYPKPEGMDSKLYESLSKARACDVMRYVLPASTLTNLGITINARSLEHMIRKLLSSPLHEMNGIGRDIKEEVLKIIPTLVKYADLNPYISETDKSMEPLARKITGHEKVKTGKAVSLVEWDPEAENRLVASILYRYSGLDYGRIKEKVSRMKREEKERIFDEYLRRMRKHDWPMRELEHVNYTFDILSDYGAFRDIQRHRMCTQTNQELTTANGYDMPEEIKEIGPGKSFMECMDFARQTFEKISGKFPKEAQYVVPLAFRKRTLFTMNLRELYHFIKLRSSKEGHSSYRKIAREMYELLKEKHPLFARYVRIEQSEGPSRGR